MISQDRPCELCANLGGTVLWNSPECRVVRVADADYPGFCRVIANSHVREMTDFSEAIRQAIMRVVFATETAVRQLYSPDKVNLASFGNVVPHVHWHVIPRWRDDHHYPEPVWGRTQREVSVVRPAISDDAISAALADLLGASLG